MLLPKFDRVKNVHLVQDKIHKNCTLALFKELEDGRSDVKPLWSLKDWKETYLEVMDPTEYFTAQHLIGDWDHWCLLAKSYSVGPYIRSWREELDVKIRAYGVARIKKQAASTNGFAAAKYLAEHGWNGKSPKLKESQKEVEEKHSEIIAHSKRMGIVNA